MDWFLQDEAGLRDLVTQFEAGTLPLSDRRHAINLSICVWYLLTDNFPLTRLRVAIRNYCEVQGGVNGPDSGYHETLTRFWLLMVEKRVKTLPVMSALEYARVVVDELGGQASLFRRFYGEYDVVRSAEARVRWVPPAADSWLE